MITYGHKWAVYFEATKQFLMSVNSYGGREWTSFINLAMLFNTEVEAQCRCYGEKVIPVKLECEI
jgi:hypothetical protein